MSARDELYAYGTAAFETGVPPVVHEHLTKRLNAYKAEVLREAAQTAEGLRRYEHGLGRADHKKQQAENAGITRVADALRHKASEAATS